MAYRAKRENQLASALALFICAHALHWFIGGQSNSATSLRASAVALQAVAAAAIALWFWRRSLRA